MCVGSSCMCVCVFGYHVCVCVCVWCVCVCVCWRGFSQYVYRLVLFNILEFWILTTFYLFILYISSLSLHHLTLLPHQFLILFILSAVPPPPQLPVLFKAYLMSFSFFQHFHTYLKCLISGKWLTSQVTRLNLVWHKDKNMYILNLSITNRIHHKVYKVTSPTLVAKEERWL